MEPSETTKGSRNIVKARIQRHPDFMRGPNLNAEVHFPAPAMPKRHGCARNTVLGGTENWNEHATVD